MPKNKVETFFDRLYKISGKELPDPNTLTQDQKCGLAYHLVQAGENKTAVANYFGVSRPTIYAWLEKARSELLTEIENKTFSTLFADILSDLMSRRDLYRKVISNLTDNEDTIEIDPATGLPVKKTTHLRNLAEMGRLARDYDKIIVELMQYVGFIPRNDMGSLFTTLKERDPEVQNTEKDLIDYSDEEISMALLKKLTQKQEIVLGDTKLKKLKDTPLL